jgi:hypothetical protein
MPLPMPLSVPEPVATEHILPAQGTTDALPPFNRAAASAYRTGLWRPASRDDVPHGAITQACESRQKTGRRQCDLNRTDTTAANTTRQKTEDEMVRRKLRIVPTGKPRAETVDDYLIYVTAQRLPDGRFLGDLSLVRTTDGRQLYPFDGASAIGPFTTVEQAREAAVAHGKMLAEADIQSPEP